MESSLILLKQMLLSYSKTKATLNDIFNYFIDNKF